MNVLIDKSQKLKADDNQQNRFYGLFDRDQMDRKRPLATGLFLVTKVWMVKRHHQIRASTPPIAPFALIKLSPTRNPSYPSAFKSSICARFEIPLSAIMSEPCGRCPINSRDTSSET